MGERNVTRVKIDGWRKGKDLTNERIKEKE